MSERVFISYSSADAQIAEAVCNGIEEAGYHCWIAPRDIRITDWASAIIDGLHECGIFVVIISKNSIYSKEVIKEVAEATKTCDYIFPFKTDYEMLPDKLKYHLGPCHWLYAMKPPLEDRIKELVDRIEHLSEEDAVYSNQRQWKLRDRAALPHGLFIGRDKEIEEIAELLKTEHAVFLYGIGGLGKSEIAKGYAEKYRDKYDTIVFSTYVACLKDLICSDEFYIENLKRYNGEDRDSWYLRKMNALRSISNDRVLLIIDNFDADYDECLDEFLNVPCKFLFTTRIDHSDYPTVKVGPIADLEQVKSIFTYHYGKSLSTSDIKAVEEILTLIDRHTITVELIAKQMRASFIKPARMLEMLKQTGVNIRLKEKIRREGESEKHSAFDYVRGVFSLSNLSKEECSFLRSMCMVPLTGIQVQDLGTILGLEDYDIINTLIGKSWVILDEADDRIRMHPVIKDVVNAELAPNPESCAAYIQGLYRRVEEIWHFSAEEKQRLYPLVTAVIHDFPVPPKELLHEYSHFVNILWICGDFDLSYQEAKKLFDFACRQFGSESYEAGRSALDCANACHNSGYEDEAEKWYRTAVKSFGGTKGEVNPHLAQALFKIGRCRRMCSDRKAAKEYYDLAGDVYDAMIAKNIKPEGRLDLLVEQERLLVDEARFEEAIKLCEENLENIREALGEDSPNMTYCLLDMGICFSKTGRYSEAEKHFKHGLDIINAHTNRASLLYVRLEEAMGDNAICAGDSKGAEELFKRLEVELLEGFGEDNPNTVRIQNKIKMLQNLRQGNYLDAVEPVLGKKM